MKKLLTATIVAALASGLAISAFAQTHSAKKEITTAHVHALMAQSATSVTMAHTHLHHVVNCLVGSKGKGFDATAGNPCKGQGNGALSDSAGNHAAHAKAQTALADAQAGLAASQLAAIQKDAAKAASTLQAAPAQKAGGGKSW